MSKGSLIVITGPTAVGKTDLTLEIAERFNVPVINADSRQLYKELKIGTASPTDKQLKRVRHYFVGTLGIEDYYSASMYEQQAVQLIEEQLKSSKYALMSGGSMMYIDAVCNGIDDIPTVNDNIRAEMKRRLAEEGLEALVEELKRLDPEHYKIVDRRNPRRVVHALEICHQTGRTYTSFRTAGRKQRSFNIIKIGLNREREELYQRINCRVDQMMNEGMLEETLRMMPYRDTNALNTVGYKELFKYIDGEWTLNEAVERIKGNTRRYARKQLTWLKRDEQISWFHPNQLNEIINHISHNNE